MAFDIHLYIHNADDHSVTALLQQVLSNQRKVMATLEDIQASEEHEGTAVGQLADAVTALKDGMAALQQQLTDALSGTTLPPAVQAKVDAAFSASKANSVKVDGILASLAPPPPVPG